MSPRPKIALDLEKIIEAAAEIADQQGLEEVTLANLAKKLAIRPPSLYNHVAGLAGLKKELAAYGYKRLYSELVERAFGKSGDEAVLALGMAYIQFARKHPGVYEAALSATDMKDRKVQEAAGKIVDLTVRVLKVYELDEENALHAVRGFRSLLHGFAALEQKGGFQVGLDLDTSIRLNIKAILAGIKH